MIYLFHDEAGLATLNLEGDDFKHMIKARRHVVGDILLLRKGFDPIFYHYKIEAIHKKNAFLSFVKSETITTQQGKTLHLGWSMIDPKSIEKVLPSLCELGVTQISFLSAKRTQQQFKIDERRLDRIIKNSMQQSGRIDHIELFFEQTLEDFSAQHPKALVLDFCEHSLEKEEYYDTVILGPEGGFSDEEKKFLKDFTVRKLDTPMVLRSETAALAIASKMLL